MAIDAKWSDFSNLDAERAIALAQERLPGIVTLVLVVIVAWQAAGVFWQLIPASPSGDPITVTPPPAAGSGAPQSASADVEAIAAAHLFGELPADAPEPTPVPGVDPEELEETRLSLTLKGTMAGSEVRWVRPAPRVSSADRRPWKTARPSTRNVYVNCLSCRSSSFGFSSSRSRSNRAASDD